MAVKSSLCAPINSTSTLSQRVGSIIPAISTNFHLPPPIMVIGYSFGANTLRNIALMHPPLHASLVLLEHFISHFASKPAVTTRGPSGFTMSHREVWPSRAGAAASFRRSASYQTWDPRVLERCVGQMMGLGMFRAKTK